MEKSNDRFRLMYDTKGRFVLHSLSAEEAKFKLARIVGSGTQAKGVPFAITHDGRTLRYPDPLIKKNDTVKLDLATGKVRRPALPGQERSVWHSFSRARRAAPPARPPPQIVDFIKFEIGNTVMVTKGRSTGRVGTVVHLERHPGSFDIAHIKDSVGHTFATRLSNIFTIGKTEDAATCMISLPHGKGIKLDIFQQRDRGAKA
jgi:small subunit ribosomal protein S4e